MHTSHAHGMLICPDALEQAPSYWLNSPTAL